MRINEYPATHLYDDNFETHRNQSSINRKTNPTQRKNDNGTCIYWIMYSRVGEYMYSPNVYSPSIHHRKNMYSPFCSIQIRSIHVLTKTVLTDLVNTLRSIHMYSPSCIHRDYTVVTTPYCSLQIWGLLSINAPAELTELARFSNSAMSADSAASGVSGVF